MNDNEDEFDPPKTGEILAALEGLHQRVHVLERALVGVAAFATDEQRHAVAKLIDQAESSYFPIILKWPEMRSRTAKEMARVAASYKALFSA